MTRMVKITQVALLGAMLAGATGCSNDMDDLHGERPQPGNIRWIDLLAHQARLVESPLDIREALREQMAKSAKAWIFTSATLGDDDRLRWFTEPAGLDDARVLRLGSPFDYRAHARVFVPRLFPKPSDPGHADAVARLAARCASALGGRTFVLTTTLRSLQAIGAQLRNGLDAAGEQIEVLVQGQGSKRQLMQRFLDAPRAVLVGSQSFWEGIDVPGEPKRMIQKSWPSGMPFTVWAQRKLRGGGENCEAMGPRPSPSLPWHVAHATFPFPLSRASKKSSRPSAAARGSLA